VPDRPSRENPPAKYELDPNSHQSPRRRPEYQRVLNSESAGIETSLTDLALVAKTGRESLRGVGQTTSTDNKHALPSAIAEEPSGRPRFFLRTANCKKTSMVGGFLILSYLTPPSKQRMIRGVPRAIAENIGQFLCSRKGVVRMTRPNKRYKIGRYGSGTLSCLKTQRAIYILFISTDRKDRSA
jgi:hypothetical protein